MKPDWDKLMSEFAGSATQLVGDVDCTAAGKPLCDANGVKGYPTLKWGDPNALEDYKGARDLKALTKFANDNLKPVCSPANVDLCEDDKKADTEKFSAMSDADLDTAIDDQETIIEDAESDFKKAVEELQATYTSLMEAKDKAAEDVKASGLGLMKSVKAHKAKSGGNDEL